MSKKLLTYVEVDINYCSLTYGTSPCTASIPGTGSERCFNTRNVHADCQDPANFSGATKTLRYTVDSGHLPRSIEATPSLISADILPARLKPAESIGERVTATVKFRNHRTGDAELDKYVDTRSYDPFQQGTYWGKFVARNSYIEGQPIRIYRGFLGQSLDEMEVHHLFIDGIDGPNSQGITSVRCVDVFRFLDNQEAQAPLASTGTLSIDISEIATTAILQPAGIGNAEYPSAGKVTIGEEICEFTRSNDTLSLTRAQEGTTADEHQAEDTVQLCLEYSGMNAASILEDLILNYTDIPASYIDSANWQAEVANFNSSTFYGDVISQPTAVKTLINQIVEQVGLVLYPDVENQKIALQVLRPLSASALTITDSQILESGISVRLKETSRVSQVWTYYQRKNKVESYDDEKNYHSQLVTLASENLYNKKRIKKVFANWITQGAFSVAQALNNRVLSRYKNPPREFTFYLHPDVKLKLGQGFNLQSRINEQPNGSQLPVPCRIISLNKMGDRVKVMAEELRFDANLLGAGKTIVIDNDSYNLNLRSLYNSIYGSIDASDIIEFVITSGTIVGSQFTAVPAITTGDWSDGPTPLLTNNGFIVGRGGNGLFWQTGEDGGDAIHVESSFEIENNGAIGGGGGAGGSVTGLSDEGFMSASGGGGAGFDPGIGGGADTVDGGRYQESLATLEQGGSGFDLVPGPVSGDGGDLGAAGATSSNGTSGGNGGAAVSGDSLVTWTNLGDVRGARLG